MPLLRGQYDLTHAFNPISLVGANSLTVASHRVFFQCVFSIEFALSDLVTTFFDLTGQNIYKIEFFLIHWSICSTSETKWATKQRYIQPDILITSLARIWTDMRYLSGCLVDHGHQARGVSLQSVNFENESPSSRRKSATNQISTIKAPSFTQNYFTLPKWRTETQASTGSDKVRPASWARPSRFEKLLKHGKTRLESVLNTSLSNTNTLLYLVKIVKECLSTTHTGSV